MRTHGHRKGNIPPVRGGSARGGIVGVGERIGEG